MEFNAYFAIIKIFYNIKNYFLIWETNSNKKFNILEINFVTLEIQFSILENDSKIRKWLKKG